MRALGVVLLVLGLLAVAYGGFWYTTDEADLEIGPLQVEVKQRRRVNVPLWSGIVIAVVGALVVVAAPRE